MSREDSLGDEGRSLEDFTWAGCGGGGWGTGGRGGGGEAFPGKEVEPDQAHRRSQGRDKWVTGQCRAQDRRS